MKTKTTTIYASAEDRRCVQGIEDNNGGDIRSTTGQVDWKRQWSVDFPCFQVANSNTVSSLSIRCLVLIFFSSGSFPPVCCMKYYQYYNHVENIFAPNVH